MVILGHFVNRKLIKVAANNYLYTFFFFAAEWWILHGSNAPNLRRIVIRILSQTASSSGCERNWSTFNLIHSKEEIDLDMKGLKTCVCPLQFTLESEEARERTKKKEYTGPIDLTEIFCDDGDEEDPLYEWVKEAGEPILDERNGRPSSHIASRMGVNVDAFIQNTTTEPATGLAESRG